jgi:hypothetical protein
LKGNQAFALKPVWSLALSLQTQLQLRFDEKVWYTFENDYKTKAFKLAMLLF